MKEAGWVRILTDGMKCDVCECIHVYATDNNNMCV